MGDRGNIIIDEKIYLYSHWSGSSLMSILKSALKRGVTRWDDRPYLIRVIFSEMIKDDINGTTGYGIDYEYGDGGTDINVNTRQQTVDGVTFEEFIK